MLIASDWRIDATKILTKREVAAVPADRHRKACQLTKTLMHLMRFRPARALSQQTQNRAGCQPAAALFSLLGDVSQSLVALVVSSAIRIRCSVWRLVPSWRAHRFT